MEIYSGVATLGSSRHVPIHKFDNFFLYKTMLHFPTEYPCRYVPCLNL